MRRNNVIDRFGLFVVHIFEGNLKFMLRMIDIAKNGEVKELILVKDDVARIDNALVYRIP